MIDEIIKILNVIINKEINAKEVNDALLINLKKQIIILNDSKDIEKELAKIYKEKNKENKAFFDYYFLEIIKGLTLKPEIILNILNWDIDYIIKDYLFNELSNDNKLNYLNKAVINIKLVNKEIKKDNQEFILYLFKNLNIIKKLTDNSLIIPIDIFDKYLNLTKLDEELLTKISNDSITQFLNFKYKKISDLGKLLNDNPKILSFINDQGITIKILDKEELINNLKNNVNILPKIDAIYIIKYLKINDLDDILNYHFIEASNNTLFYINQLKVLLGKDKNFDATYFINNSDDYKLVIYPFNNNYEKYQDLIKDYKKLKKFSYEIIAMVVNNYYNIDERIKLFRNEDFIKDMPGIYLTEILKTLNLRTGLNLLQNKKLYEKIVDLDLVIEELDKSLINSYLLDPDLINISSNDLVYKALDMEQVNNLKKYLTYPYLRNKLNFYDFIKLASRCKIKVATLYNKYKITDYNPQDNWFKEYIDKAFGNNANFNFISSLDDLKLIFNLDAKTASKINMEEFRYLFEMVKNKGNLKNNNIFNYEGLKALLCSYLYLGFNNTVKLINTGSRELEFNDILNIKRSIKEVKLLEYKIDNTLIFDNLINKLRACLSPIKIMYTKGMNNLDFSSLIYDYPFLKNIIRIMEKSGYAKSTYSLNVLERYLVYLDVNKLTADRILNNYATGFINHLMQKESKLLDKEILNTLNKSLVLTDNAYKRFLTTSRINFLNKYHFKLFTYLLSKRITDKDLILFKEKPIKVLEDYGKIIVGNNKLFNLNNLVILFKDYYKEKLDIKEYLRKELDIYEPFGYQEYLMNNEVEILVKKINSFVISNFNKTDIRLNVYNDILYGSISYNYKNNILVKIKEFHTKLLNYNIKVYLDETLNSLIFDPIISLDNIEEIKNYDKLINYINSLIGKTKKYLNTVFDDDKIIKIYKEAFNKYKLGIVSNYPLTKNNFKINQISFDINNLINIFKDVNLNNLEKLDEDDENFLFKRKNIYYAGLGIVENYNISFGEIINNLKEIKSIYAESDLSLEKLDLENASKLTMYLNKRIKDRNYLYYRYTQAKMISSSIPYVSGINDYIYFKTLDKWDMEINEVNKNYILNKDTCFIELKDIITNEMLATVMGMRYGNVLLIDVYNIDDDKILETIDKCGEKILKMVNSKDGTETIDFLILRGKDIKNGIRLTKNNLPYYDSLLELNNNHPLEDISLYVTNELKEIKPSNFLEYTPFNEFLRKRKKVKVINNTDRIKNLDKAKEILKIYAIDNHLSYSELLRNLDYFNYIYIGDDWLVIVNDKSLVTCFTIGNDERTEEEMLSYLNKNGRDSYNVRNYYRLQR